MSVDISRNGDYIRNLSCQLYDENGEELSAYYAEGDNFGFKVDVGEQPKVVKITAKSTPITGTAQYIESYTSSNRAKGYSLSSLVLPAGVYKQDEFAGFIEAFGPNQNIGDYNYSAMSPWRYFYLRGGDGDKININRIGVSMWNAIWFATDNGAIPEDALIEVTDTVCFYEHRTLKATNLVYGEVEYPAVGYYTDYALEHVITPSENAPCYAEQEVNDPEPEPEPEPTPDPDPETPTEE